MREGANFARHSLASESKKSVRNMSRYQFANTVPFFEQYSNRYESLAKCIANEWTRLSHSTTADRILDFGSGDGSLLRLTLRQRVRLSEGCVISGCSGHAAKPSCSVVAGS